MSQSLEPLDEYTRHRCWSNRVGHAIIPTGRLRDIARDDGLHCGDVDVPTGHGANQWYRLYRQRGSIRRTVNIELTLWELTHSLRHKKPNYVLRHRIEHTLRIYSAKNRFPKTWPKPHGPRRPAHDPGSPVYGKVARPIASNFV